MSGNSFGQLFRIHTFGESHGVGIGVVIEGCPAGIEINEDLILKDLQRRKPGQSKITTSRDEDNNFVVQSGVFEGISTGMPISIYIPNKDFKSEDYNHLVDTFRPSHADMSYQYKYGIRDHRGGGRSSARETATRVAAGAIAKMLLSETGVRIDAGVTQVGHIKTSIPLEELNWNSVESNIVRCPDKVIALEMEKLIHETKEEGNSLGGKISCIITNCPVGLGEPVFDKLHADLAKAMMSINAVKGFEYGSGFNAISMKGSEHNDIWEVDGTSVKTKTNNSGGIQGGISNGMPIYFNVAFKPVATIMKDQPSITKDGQATIVPGKGRHDPCVVPRAVPIVEAMAALVLADHYLRSKTNKIIK